MTESECYAIEELGRKNNRDLYDLYCLVYSVLSGDEIDKITYNSYHPSHTKYRAMIQACDLESFCALASGFLGMSPDDIRRYCESEDPVVG